MRIEFIAADLSLEVVHELNDIAAILPCQVLYAGKPLIVLSPAVFSELLLKGGVSSSLSQKSQPEMPQAEQLLPSESHSVSLAHASTPQAARETPLHAYKPVASLPEDSGQWPTEPSSGNVGPTESSAAQTLCDEDDVSEDEHEFSPADTANYAGADDEVVTDEISQTSYEQVDQQHAVAEQDSIVEDAIEEYHANEEGYPRTDSLIELTDPMDIEFEAMLAESGLFPKEVVYKTISFVMEASLLHTQATQDEKGNFFTLAGTPCARDGKGVSILPLANATPAAPWGMDSRTGEALAPANLRFALIKERQAIYKLFGK